MGEPAVILRASTPDVVHSPRARRRECGSGVGRPSSKTGKAKTEIKTSNNKQTLKQFTRSMTRATWHGKKHGKTHSQDA